MDLHEERPSFADDFKQEGMHNEKSMSYRTEIADRLKKKRRGWTFYITVLALLLTIVLTCIAFLISVKNSKRLGAVSSDAVCGDNCQFELVETIPNGMTYPGFKSNPRISDRMQKLLLSAEKTIDIASSYWTLKSSDVKGGPYPMADVGQQIFDLLVKAAYERGVKIRIVHQVFCVKGHCTYPTNDTDSLAKLENVEVRTLDVKRLQGSGIIHTKMWLVDGKQIYLGSANMDWRSLTEVKELGIMTYECPCVAQDMSKIYEAYWLLAKPSSVIPKNWPSTFQTVFNKDNPLTIKQTNSTTKVFLGSSPPSFCPSNRTTDIDAILHNIQVAKKFVHIAVMDYVAAIIYTYPNRYWDVIDRALRTAAYDRGIQVRLLASNWTDTKPQMFPMLKSLQAFSKACKYGSIEVKLFNVPPGKVKIPFTRVNHNKYMVTDMAAYIGTSNWSGDYFINTAGIGYTIWQSTGNQSFQANLSKVFDRDWNSKYATTV